MVISSVDELLYSSFVHPSNDWWLICLHRSSVNIVLVESVVQNIHLIFVKIVLRGGDAATKVNIPIRECYATHDLSSPAV